MFEVTKNHSSPNAGKGRPRLQIPFEKLAEKDDSFLVPNEFAKQASVKMAAWRYGKEHGITLRTNKEEGGMRVTRC